MDELTKVWDSRKGTKFLDFMVSGMSLYEIVGRKHDFIGCLGWVGNKYDNDARARLLLGRKPDLPSGRVSLYICPECADLGCGSIGAFVKADGDFFIWSDFAYEANYDACEYGDQKKPFSPSIGGFRPGMIGSPLTNDNREFDDGSGPYLIEDLGPFKFDAENYKSVLFSESEEPKPIE